MKTAVLCASIAGLIAAAANAQNANITWGTPNAISGTANVSTSGSLVGTWAPGDDWGGGNIADNVPVNGVTFNAYGSGPFNSFINQSGFSDRYGSFANPGTPDSNYNYLLQTAEYNNAADLGGGNFGPSALSMTWGGMTAGNTYQLEFWVQDGRNSVTAERSETLTGGANTSAALAYGFGSSGPGQYVIGTFVADGNGQQTLTLNASGGAVLRFSLPGADKELTNSRRSAPLTGEPHEDIVSDAAHQLAYEGNK